MVDLRVLGAGFSVFVLAVAIAAAAVVYFTRPRPLQNRALAVLLYLEGALVGSIGLGGLADSDTTLSEAFYAIPGAAVAAAPWIYLLLVSTLRSPLALGSRSAMARRSFVVAAVVSPVLAVWSTRQVGWGLQVALFFFAVVSVYALIVAWDAWRRSAAGSVERARAGSFFLAFGVRDVLWVVFIIWVSAIGGVQVEAYQEESELSLLERLSLLVDTVPALITLVYVSILAYGILRTQLFDIEIRIKRSIAKGVLLSSFVVVFLVASEVAEWFLVSRFTDEVAGVAAAVALALFFRPLDRGATWLADRLLPNIGGEDYVRLRKVEVYRAALEGAMQDGVVTEREREMLLALRLKLALDDRTVAELEFAPASPADPSS